MCLVLGTVDGCVISLFLSAFLVLQKFSNPVIKYKSNLHYNQECMNNNNSSINKR